MESRQDLLMYSLTKYYDNITKFNLVIPVITQQTRISLRILDWLVTNYSKKFNCGYILNGENFNIHKSYKNQLKSYSKKLFDPFCRRERIIIDKNTFKIVENGVEDDDKTLSTTVGQLNFFRWAIENKILDYAVKYIEDIETDMNSNVRKYSNLKLKQEKIIWPPNDHNTIKAPSVIKFT
jgi:hypothetical protein